MKKIDIVSLIDECYNEYIYNNKIVGLERILRAKGLGSKRIIKLRNFIYEKYGKENLIEIYRSRLAKSSHKSKSKDSYKHSEEWRKKVSISNILTWKNSPESRRELSRQSMIKHCFPNSQTPETKKKRVESRKGYKHTQETIDKIKNAQKGRPLTEEHKQKLRKPKSKKRQIVYHTLKTRKKLSDITKLQWKNGIHKRTFKSKGQLEVIEILVKLGYDVEDEYLLDGRPYDAFVKNKKLLIEFNGTFWHRDPRFYNDKSTKKKFFVDAKCRKVWEKDLEKIDIAKRNNYNIKIVWQYDWENCNDKIEYIKQILC